MMLYLWFGIDKQDGLAGYFEDARVRQAVAYGVNRQALADAIPQAVGPQPDSYLPPGHPYHAERAVNLYPYDPARARELLGEAGWVDTDQDGVLDKAGLPFHANAIVREGDSEAIQVIQLVGQDLEKIGIKIEITRVATEEYYANHSEAPLFGRKYDLYLFRGGGVSTRPDCKVFSGAAIPGPGNDWKGLNLAGYSNSEFDAACLAGLASLDPERARDFHIEAQRIFSQDLPALPLFITPKFSITSPEVSGFIIDPASEDSELWMMEEIRLEAVP